jgi:hypothetical protein
MKSNNCSKFAHLKVSRSRPCGETDKSFRTTACVAVLLFNLFAEYPKPSLATAAIERSSCKQDVILSTPDSEAVVEAFLSAADRGELVVLGRTVTRSEITPLQMSIHYDLQSSEHFVEVYATLNTAVSLPGTSEQITAISCFLSESGEILEVQLHIWEQE